MDNRDIDQKNLEHKIFTIRGVQVMIDRDLATLYQVETRILNQSVKRNIDRFPESFRFALSVPEFKNWTSQIVMSNEDKMGLRHRPYAFTEQGVAMLSAILRSDTAIKVSIQIMNAFVEMRKILITNASLFQRIDKVELKQIEADQKFEHLFKALESKNLEPEKGIFYDGQIFDAYTFVANIIRSATKSIVLIDNYIDDTVLTLFTKRANQVTLTCFTKKISKQMALDIEKYNAQYPPISIKEMPFAHDRFLIIDYIELYHLGASLKDLGKKWFAFSKMNTEVSTILEQLKKSNN